MDPERKALQVSASFAGTTISTTCLYQGSDAYLLGSSSRADLPYLTPSSRDVPLIDSRDGRFILRVQDHWQGFVWASERMWTLDELRESGRAAPCSLAHTREYAIPTDGVVQLQLGALEIEMQSTAPVAKLPARPWLASDDPTPAYVLGIFALALIALFAIATVPDEEQWLYDETQVYEERWIQIRSEVPTDTRHSAAPALRPAYATTRPRPPVARDAPDTSPEPILESDIETPPTESRDQREARAREAGIVGLLEVFENGEFMKAAAATKFDSSLESNESYGDLAPSDLDQRTGAWGHGITKIGPGSGDGKDWGTVEAGDYEMASASARGDEYVKKALTRPHAAQSPTLSSAASAIIGSGLKYDVIRGQIGLRQRRFRRCFERDETGDDPWPGSIFLQFHISASGEVAEVGVQDVTNPNVRACIEETLLSIRFPEPADGKEIRVQAFPLRI